MYRLLLDHRDELWAEQGAFTRFAEDEVRVILRPTRVYWLLFYEGFHPDLLRDGLDRDQFLDRLWVGVEPRPELKRVLPAERRAIENGDVPIFTVCADARNIWPSSGEPITDFCEESGLALARRSVSELSAGDLKSQTWLIRATLASLALSGTWIPKAKPHRTVAQTDPTPGDLRGKLLESAVRVGDALASSAVRSGAEATWLGITEAGRTLLIGPVGMDLYSGLSGIALFLAQLGAVAGSERHAALARATLTTLRRQISTWKSSFDPIGGFMGWGGIVYALARIGLLWHEPDMLREAEEAAELAQARIERDTEHDIVSGAAGCIGALLSLHRCRPSERILAGAVQCGDQLIRQAQTMPRGIGWPNKRMGELPLTGFSHGAAGFAWALLRLSAATGEERFRTAALAALEYERSQFIEEKGNWLDLRSTRATPDDDDKDQQHFMTAWCHGAPGIGLARLDTLSCLDDPTVRSEIAVALKTTIAEGFGYNHSLCHGDLGNLEFLLQASRTFNDPALKSQVNQIAASILDSIEEYGWLCGLPLTVESPDLMVGLAGIGYELLRLAEPDRVPSVLLLESPK
jgi:type 2 lantibiotic biosynthesis protein LanM